jgi:hypothetical protein
VNELLNYICSEIEKILIKNIQMKSLIKISLVTLFVIAGTTAVKAQQSSTATAAASATIIEPIVINKTSDLNFGSLGVSTTTAGTVVLAPGGGRTPSGGVFLPTSGASGVSAASFTVTGQSGFTYAITLPSAPVTITNGTQNMTVTNFTSTPATTGTLTGGTQTLNVGATLNVDAAQAAGTYTTTTPFDVTVNYN